MKALTLLLSMLTSLFCCPQPRGSLFNHKEREHGNATGHYEVAAAINKTQISRGDSAQVSIFITGYGQIDRAKVFVSSSTNEIFDVSRAYFGFDDKHALDRQNVAIIWGGQSVEFNKLPF